MPKLAAALYCLLVAGPLAAEALGKNNKAPEWTLADSKGEQIVFESAVRDKPAVLLFWATWCPYCRALMPHLEALKQSLPDDSVNFYALNIWEDADPAAYLRDNDLSFILLPKAESVAKRYHVKGTPGLFLIGVDGLVKYQRRSGDKPEAVVEAIRQSLEANTIK
ncbi:MAG: TlpA family protein disulfide reductase [Pseudomonadales bacterium]